MRLVHRPVLAVCLALLLISCGMGGRPALGEIGDRSTLIDEPLLVELAVAPGTESVEAIADDPDGVLAGGPAVGGTSAAPTLLLQPGALASGAAQITVTAVTGGGSISETFGFEVVPPYRSLAQVFDLADHAQPGYLNVSLALDGTRLVAAVRESTHEGVRFAGAAYVYELGENGWQFTAKLTPGDAYAGQSFGSAVDISGDLIIVGAGSDDEVDDGAGAAYIFLRDGDGWLEVAKLIPSLAGTHQGFGDAVAIDGNLAVVGAWTGSNYGYTNNGQIYIFARGGGAWDEVALLNSGHEDNYDYFGREVAVDGSVVVSVVAGNTGWGLGPSFGEAYVFEPGPDGWRRTASLNPIVTESERFGSALAVEGDTVVVGASHLHAGGDDPGAIYVFERSGTEFDRVTKLVSGESGQDGLGAYLAFAGDYVLSMASSGGEEQLYLFKRNGDSWALVNTIASSVLQAPGMGGSMVLSRERAIVSGADGSGSFLHLPR